MPLGDGELVADAGIRGSSSYELTDIATLVFFYQPSYTKTDLSLTYRGADDAWNVGVFVENLENNLVLTSAAFGQFDGVSFADPRQFGIRVGASF